MKFLITGANGQLGSEWVSRLTDLRRNFTAYSSDRLDITHRPQVQELMAHEMPDVVINCAAYTNVDRAEAEAEKAFLVNERGVQNLMDVCSAHGIKLVHFSTDYVFAGDQADRLRYPGGYPEDADSLPVNAYGSSKRAGERVLSESGEGSNRLLIRVSWLCGRYGSNFVKTMLRMSRERAEIPVVTDQTGSPTYTFDLVDKTLALLEKKCSGTFHVSSKGEISWAQFAEEIFKISGSETKVVPIPSEQYVTTAKRPSFSLLSTEKIQKNGLEPIHWKSGLERLMKQLNVAAAHSLDDSQENGIRLTDK